VSVSVSLDKRMEGADRKLTPSAATLHKPSIFMPYQNIMCCCNAPAGGFKNYTAEACIEGCLPDKLKLGTN